MKKKVLVAVLCIIIAVPILFYWYSTSKDAYKKDMDAIQEMMERLPDKIIGALDSDFRAGIEDIRVITKEGKEFKKIYLHLIDLNMELDRLGRNSFGVSYPATSELRVAEIDVEMEQYLEKLYNCIEDFIDAAEDADVGEYKLDRFVDYIY